MKSTPLRCFFSSPDQITSYAFISPTPVHLISDRPMMSYLYLFSFILSSSNCPVDHSVLTFHILTFIMSRATLNFGSNSSSLYWSDMSPINSCALHGVYFM